MARARSAAFSALIAPFESSPGASFLFLKDKKWRLAPSLHSLPLVDSPSTPFDNQVDLLWILDKAHLLCDFLFDLSLERVAGFSLNQQ